MAGKLEETASSSTRWARLNVLVLNLPVIQRLENGTDKKMGDKKIKTGNEVLCSKQ